MGHDIRERELLDALVRGGGWLPHHAVKITGLRPEDWRDERGRPDYDAPTTAWLTPHAGAPPMYAGPQTPYRLELCLMSAERAEELARLVNADWIGVTATVHRLKVELI